MSAETRQQAIDPTGEEHISEEERSRIRAEIAVTEYEQLRGKERDVMQTRYQIWAGAILLLSILAAVPSYAVIIGSLLFASAARYIRGGEVALRTMRPYLRMVEKRCGYQGYECYYDSLEMKEHGISAKAVRDMLLLCEALTLVLLGIRLWSSRPSLPEIIAVSSIAAFIVGASMFVTWRWMKTPPKPRPKERQEGAHEAVPQTHQSQAQEQQP